MKNWRTVDPSANIHLSDRALLSDAELGDDRTVTFDIDAGQVVEKATAATSSWIPENRKMERMPTRSLIKPPRSEPSTFATPKDVSVRSVWAELESSGATILPI